MLPAILISRSTLVENIKSLETQLADLQERLNVIADWINSQYFEFLDIPETVLIAIRGYDRPSLVSVVTKSKNNKISKTKVSSSHLGKQKANPCMKKVTSTDETEELNPNNYPVIKLDKLSLPDIEVLTHRHGITNLHSVQTALSNSNLFEESSLPFCPICNKNFKLKIQLQRHNLKYHSKNTDIKHNESSGRKRRNYNLTATNEESVNEDVSSSEESDSGSEYDPLADAHSNESCEEDTLENIDKNIVSDVADVGVDCVIKDEVDIKQETAEDDVFISQDTTSSETQDQKKGNSPTHLLSSRKKSGDILMQKQSVKVKSKRIRIGKNRKILTLSEYENLIPSNRLRSSNCVACSRLFSTIYLAARHEISVHLTKEDGKKYLIKRRSERKDFTCRICGQPCKTLAVLNSHQNSHVSSEVVSEVNENGCPIYRCLNCDSLFSDKQKCIIHVVRYCTNEKQQETPKKITDIKHKKVKKRQMNSNKEFQCEICGINLCSNYQLKSHMETHTGREKNFLCSQCGERFARSHTLLSHQLAIHIKERSHKCQYCEKTFVLKYVRNAHEKKHLRVSAVCCDICGFTFACSKSLKKHIAGVHENQRPYKCHLCDKSFKTSTARNYHINTHNNPNGRKRGLNKEIDHLKAAAKRRHCPILKDHRIPLLNSLMDSSETSKIATQNTLDADILPGPQK